MASTATSGGPIGRTPPALVIGFGVFLVVIGYLVVASLTRRTAPVFAPTVRHRAVRPGAPGRPDTVTIDARDENRWVYVDLDRGLPLEPGDSAGWDVAIRRYRIRAVGAAALAGSEAFPATKAAALPLGATNPGRVTTELGRWYSYSMLSHLLEPGGQVHLVRTDAGATAALQVLGYYCPGLTAGCLTFRYAVLPPNGSS